ncbi:VPLPA-CTERM sorting domain-containing protein [Paracoccus caeni]|uniref:VPLPA-CTERM sorting domain-containing protein n=1 Tax=Paracoccus caeni TaxID=657651 RepID=A0A934VZ98_9RHOB|nr:VPLPA-CTERM sorting domain-containing protein [Paracoccus caeni]MBK4215073.1 VPLPA-CTERM sorting domain-containing protein [Paracoccus caeni]
MTIRKFATATSLAALASLAIASGASAATFTIDSGDITVSGADFCVPGDCTLDGAVNGGTFDLSSVGESVTLNDLFNWEILVTNPLATGFGAYGINVTLNFSSPSSASGDGEGLGGFVTLLGTVSAGALLWTVGTGSVDFAEGYQLAYELHDELEFGIGLETTTGASFTLTQIPAVVPLPATALLLMGGVGALGGVGYRRRRKAA